MSRKKLASARNEKALYFLCRALALAINGALVRNRKGFDSRMKWLLKYRRHEIKGEACLNKAWDMRIFMMNKV